MTTTAASSLESISRHQKASSHKKSFCLKSPPPSIHLKKILANYPEGPQILQEALQNADDAEAVKFVVILDERTHRSGIPTLDRFMGPAILFGNESVFTESDWRGLQNMFESDKANDPGKIGRFGMGSRSYFHMADVITVVSGGRVAYLDPDFTLTETGGTSSEITELFIQENDNNHLGDDNRHKTSDGDDNFAVLKELLKPLTGVMGFEFTSTRSCLHGTLFRLPLRMGKWAKTSTFAPYEYSTSKALELVHRFQEEAGQMLLFLQSVSEIELWRWRQSDDGPCALFHCHIGVYPTDPTATSIEDRRGLIRRYLEEQRSYGRTLQSIMCQAETGILPELEETVEIEEIEFPSSSTARHFDPSGTVASNNNSSSNQTIKVFVSHSVWLLNVHMVPNSDLLTLLPTTDRPPVIGVALLACPPHRILKSVPVPVLVTDNRFDHATTSHTPCPCSSSDFEVNTTVTAHTGWLPSTPLSPSLEDRRLLWALYDDDSDEQGDDEENRHKSHLEDPTFWDIEMRMDANHGVGRLHHSDGVRSLRPAHHHRSSLDAYYPKRLKGKTYAFLPLADVISGLPVHIHGTFQLTDNRRSLWTSIETTVGQAQRMSEWNLILLHHAIPQLYSRVLLRHAKFSVTSIDMLTARSDTRAHEHEIPEQCLTPEEAEAAAHKIVRHFYSSWPDANDVALLLRPALSAFVRHVKNEKIMVRQVQSQTGQACRLASRRLMASSVSSRAPEVSLPPLRPIECQFLQLTDTETHVFNSGPDERRSDKLELLEEAVAQCQLLGHPVLYVPEFIRQLFQTYDPEPTNNPAADSTYKSLGIQHPSSSYHQSHPQTSSSRFKRLSSTSSSRIPRSVPQSGYYIITALDMFKNILIPHWSLLPPIELPAVPRFSDLMLHLCKILGRGPDKYIQKFREQCRNLPFVPVPFPGILYDDDDIVPIKAPSQCFDPLLDQYRVGNICQPGTEFRAPDVLRVLRLWDLKQSLSWTEMVQEGVSKACTVGGCHAQRSQMESFLYQSSM